MAKGQKRSNREHRKPKQNKSAEKVAAPFGAQMKAAANANTARAGGK